VLCAYGVDIDAVAGWLGSYGGEDSTSDIARGMFAGTVGVRRENPVDMTWEQQRDVLDKSYRLLTEFCGKPPRGNVVPWSECSEEGIGLMLAYGIEYDHSLGHHDCQPYYLRKGDTWTKIDYKKKAEEWMMPLVKGQETGMVEIPSNWYIDDMPPMVSSHFFAL